MSMIQVRNLTLSAHRNLVLSRVSLEIGEGVVYGLLGANGSGKSTLLSILATVTPVKPGRVLVDGFDVRTQARQVRRRVGYMPESFGMYHEMRVWEYLEFFAECYGVRGKARELTITELLQLVDLYDRRGSYVGSLSRGLAQRLALARALVHDPAVLLLDEPAASLDPRGRVEILEVLRELGGLGKTIVIASNILSELVNLCTHVGILDRGRLVFSGPVESLVAQLDAERRVRVQVLDETERTQSILQRSPQVREVTNEDHTLTFKFEGDRVELSGLLRGLVQEEVPVVAFGYLPGQLQEAFSEVTWSEAVPS